MSRVNAHLAAFPGMERYVLPVRQVPFFDPAGFLLSPSVGWPVGVEEEQPRLAADLVSGGASFALLAAGGAGKTQTLSAMSAVDPEAVWIDVGPLGREDIERRLVEFDGSCRSVYLDGLDQTAIGDPLVLQWLEGKLTASAPDRSGTDARCECRLPPSADATRPAVASLAVSGAAVRCAVEDMNIGIAPGDPRYAD